MIFSQGFNNFVILILYYRSGNINSVGEGLGKFHSINVPLSPGMNDETYVPLFENIMRKVMEHFKPNAVVVQCGADSLCNDKLGNNFL